ncbi:MAG: hypothetical protein LBT70_03345, partial [Holosporaceae bacterium]|nr:hypothetical protein [Holosporaceae bacterium]
LIATAEVGAPASASATDIYYKEAQVGYKGAQVGDSKDYGLTNEGEDDALIGSNDSTVLSKNADVQISGQAIKDYEGHATGIKYIIGGVGNSGSYDPVTGNKLSVIDETTLQDGIKLYGGYSEGEGEVNDNELTVSGTLKANNVNLYGGFSYQTAAHNELTVSGTITANTIVLGGGVGKESNNNSILDVSGILNAANVKLYGGSSDNIGNCSELTVSGTITANTILLYGGRSEYSRDNTANVSGTLNAANIELYGSHFGENGKGNKLTVSGTITANTIALYGGYSDGGKNDPTTVENNNLTVSGTITANTIALYGGYGISNGISSSCYNCYNNIVDVSGTLNAANIELYGGYVVDGNSEGNTLIIDNAVLTNVSAIVDFQNYEFDLTKFPLLSEEQTLITMGNTNNPQLAKIDKTTSIKIKYLSSENYKIINWDKAIVLIDNVEGKGGDLGGSDSPQVIFDPESVNDSTPTLLINENNALVVKGLPNVEYILPPTSPGTGSQNGSGGLDPSEANANREYFLQTKTFSEARVASLAAVQQSDNIIHHCLNNVMQLASGGTTRLILCGESEASSSCIRSGSHVNTRGFSAIVGAGLPWNSGNACVGAFSEFGCNTYESYNEGPNENEIKGNGSSNYVGCGVMWSLNTGKFDSEQFYFDGAGRIGIAKFNYGSSDIVDDTSNGALTTYDASASYHGISVGCGCISTFDSFSLNTYCRYLWVQQSGNKTILSSGKCLRIRSSSSRRSVVGLTALYKANEKFKIYLDTSYQHEFDGKINAQIDDRDIGAPSLHGNIVKSEAGISIINNNLSISMGMSVSTGASRGITGKLLLQLSI